MYSFDKIRFYRRRYVSDFQEKRSVPGDSSPSTVDQYGTVPHVELILELNKARLYPKVATFVVSSALIKTVSFASYEGACFKTHLYR